MNSDIGKALSLTGTSNTWSTLDTISIKIGKRLVKKITPKELDDFMLQVGDKASVNIFHENQNRNFLNLFKNSEYVIIFYFIRAVLIFLFFPSKLAIPELL